jgi:hypothetical protein
VTGRAGIVGSRLAAMVGGKGVADRPVDEHLLHVVSGVEQNTSDDVHPEGGQDREVQQPGRCHHCRVLTFAQGEPGDSHQHDRDAWTPTRVQDHLQRAIRNERLVIGRAEPEDLG